MQLRSWRLITAAIPSHSGRYSHDTAAISDVHQFLRGPRIPGGGLLFQLPTALSRCPGRSTRDMSRSVALVGDAHSVGACGVGTRTSGPGSVSLWQYEARSKEGLFASNPLAYLFLHPISQRGRL